MAIDEGQLTSLILAAAPAGPVEVSLLHRLALDGDRFVRAAEPRLGWWQKLGRRITWWRHDAPPHLEKVANAAQTLINDLKAVSPEARAKIYEGIDDALQARIAPLESTRLTTQNVAIAIDYALKQRNASDEKRLEACQRQLQNCYEILHKNNGEFCFYLGEQPPGRTQASLSSILKDWKLKSVEQLKGEKPSVWQEEVKKVRAIMARVAGEPWSHRFLKKEESLQFAHQDILYSGWKKYLQHFGGLPLYHHRLTTENRSGGTEIMTLSLLALMEALKKARHLEVLDVADLPLEGELYREAFIETLHHNRGIREIRLSRNEMGCEAAHQVLEELLNLKSLRHVILADVQFPEEEHPSLLQWLQDNRHLVHLNLDQNPLAESLLVGLQQGTLTLPSLEHLSIRDNKLSPQGREALLDLVQNHPNLRDVRIAGAGLSDSELAELQMVDSQRSIPFILHRD